MHKKARTKAAAALSFTVAFALTSCAPGSSAGNEETQEIRLAFAMPTLFTSALPYYVSQDQGFYEEAGLDVDVTFTDAVQGVVSGSVDIGTDTGGTQTVAAYAQGASLKVLSPAISGIDLLWFTEADSPIDSMDDLAGLDVGYSSTGSAAHTGLLAISEHIEQKGLNPINGQAIGPPADNLTAVQTEQIDAGWTQPPFLLGEVDSGELKIVAEGMDITEYENTALRVNVTSEAFLEENPEAVQAYLDTLERAWDWIFENQDEAIEIWAREADLDEPPEILSQAFDYYDRDMFTQAPLEGAEKMVDDAIEFGFIDEPLNDEELQELFEVSLDTGGINE